MNQFKSRARKPSYCKCGKEIKWVKGKGQAKAVAVEPQGIYFIPAEGGAPFVMSNGKINHGRVASDGLRGYRQHACEFFSRRVRTEDSRAERYGA